MAVPIKELVGRRVLIGAIQQGFLRAITVSEYKVLELSPSEKYIKLQNINGVKTWSLTSELTFVEVLEVLEAKPKGV